MLRVAGASLTKMATVANTPIVVILGATGAGKSQLALELAEKFGGEIISADAMQMYRGLDIVTNKVTEEEQRRVQHHMINILDPLCHNNVVDFRNKALPIVEKLLSEGRIPVICGGTNYYIESLLWKILVDDDLPFIVSGKRLIDEDNNAKKIVKSDEEVGQSEDKALTIESVDWSSDDNVILTTDLFQLLQSVDPQRASVLHPKERRKIWRSLQVFSRTGMTHSQLLENKGGDPESGFGGGLRFAKNKICIIEVWSEQSVLEERCDKRVDKMMARGLVQELQHFHRDFNTRRAQSSGGGGGVTSLSYDKGIWQSIGFKEFHDYLCLSPEQREGPEGRRLFEEGVFRMKVSTRQYSRRQAKWIRRRFLTNIRDSPPVYRVDSSDPSLWKEKVFCPGEQILQDFLSGKTPEMAPVPRICEDPEREVDYRKTLHCDICDRDFKGDTQYRNHLKSKSHRKTLRDLSEHYVYETYLLSFSKEDKIQVAQLLKNIFAIGLSDVMTNMENLPFMLSQIKSEKKAKKIVHELSKHNIVAEVKRVKVSTETNNEENLSNV